MARFVRGDVVIVPFSFSDLTQAKRRPALVLAELEGEDRVLCQITSQHVRDRYAIALDDGVKKRLIAKAIPGADVFANALEELTTITAAMI